MSHDLLPALTGRILAPSGLKLPFPPAAESSVAASPAVRESSGEAAVKALAGGEYGVTGGLEKLLENTQSFGEDLEDSLGKIGKSLSKLLKQLGRLEHEAEKVEARLQSDLRRDIHAGRFEDRTPDKALSKILHRLGHLEHRAEKFVEKARDLSEAIGAQRVDGSSEGPAVSISVSQSLVLSVQNLQLSLQSDGGEVSLSYSSIVFSVTTSVSLAIAQADAQVFDLEGRRADLLGVNNGVYLDATNEGLRSLLGGADESEATQGSTESDDTPDAVESPDTDDATLDALLLILDFRHAASFEISRLILNAGAPIGPRFEGSLPAIDQTADAISEPSEASRLDLEI